ncbi:MAG: glycosyltransferase family 39 protein [Chloroflexota bacterium]
MALMTRLQLPIMIVILLLAAVGRILHIDAESLWVDEGFSYWAIRHTDMLRIIINDVHPPLYFVGLRGWAAVAGITELALRYFSVLPSLLSVAVLYQLARELLRHLGARSQLFVPLLAALALALADMENYIAQEARMYTWHVLWACLSYAFFLRWARRSSTGQPARADQIAWIVTSVLLLYTHYVGAAALAVQGLYVVFFMRGQPRLTGVLTIAGIGVVFIPWLLAVVAGQTGNVGTGFNVPSTVQSLWNWRDEWFTGQWALVGGLALTGLAVFIAPGLLANETQHARRSHRPPAAGAGWLLLGWIVVPVAGAYVLNHFTPILMDYRLTQITPAVALLIGFGLGWFRGRALLFLVLVITVYGVAINDTPRPRPPWRAVGQNAAQYATSGDLALAHVTPSGDWQVIYYYERFMPDGVTWRSLRQWQLEEGETYAAGLPALLAEHPHVWFMHWSSDLSGFEALAAAGHVQTAVMTEDWLGNDLNVYRFDMVPPSQQAITAWPDASMILRDAVIVPDELRLDLWWSITEPVTVDYTVSAILLNDDGVLVAQDDAQPFRDQRPTSSFSPGEVVYDPHSMTVVEGLGALPPGTYTVGVKLYTFTPAGILVIPTTTGDEYVPVGTIVVGES